MDILRMLLIVSIVLTVQLAAFFTIYLDDGAYGVLTLRLQELNGADHDQAKNVLAFLADREADVAFLTTAEAAHLQDVRDLLVALRFLFLFVVVVLLSLVYLSWHEEWGSVLTTTGLVSLGITAVVALLAAEDFPTFWRAFHAVVLPQGNWLFPVDSRLITLFPLRFFAAFALDVLVAAGSFSLLLVLGGLQATRRQKVRKAV